MLPRQGEKEASEAEGSSPKRLRGGVDAVEVVVPITGVKVD